LVSITPKSEIFSIFKNLNYKAWFALAEYVDNSLQSHIDWGKDYKAQEGRPQTLEVDINIHDDDDDGGKRITITDNARGIALADFERAFQVAVRPRSSSTSLNEFGMGMKTASFWFANQWSMTTQFFGESVSRMMVFNLDEILEHKLSDIEPLVMPGSKNSHYTNVELRDLNQLPVGRTLGKIRQYLASIYRRQLSEGLLILRVNGEALEFDAPAVLVAPYQKDLSEVQDTVVWKKDVLIELGGDKRVTGWVGLKETVSAVNTGFALFRRGRLIQGGPDDPYSPEEICASRNKHQFLRLFGELDVQGFGVTHTKDAINWGDLESEFIGNLKLQLQTGDYDFLYQAIHYRVNSANKKALEALIEKVDVPIDHIEQLIQDVALSARTHGSEAVPDDLDPDERLVDKREFEHTMLDGSTWQAVVTITQDSGQGLFNVSSSAGTQNSNHDGKVEMRISSEHPFFKAYADPDLENMEPLMQFLGVLSVAIGQSKFNGGQHQSLLDAVNKVALRWVHGK
jgi:hypothetical protein